MMPRRALPAARKTSRKGSSSMGMDIRRRSGPSIWDLMEQMLESRAGFPTRRGEGWMGGAQQLPMNVCGVEAEYRNGLLSITVPKAEHAKPRQIQVKASDAASQPVSTQTPAKKETRR